MSGHQDQRPTEAEEQPADGQVSDVGALGEDSPGGADATDKSTGTAPSRADEPAGD